MKRTLYTPDRRTVTDNLTEVEDRYLTDEVILRYLVWLQDRIVNVNDLINEDHQFLWKPPTSNLNLENNKEFILKCSNLFTCDNEYTEVLKGLRKLCKDYEVKLPKLMKDLRVLMTGKPEGPPLKEIVDILGMEESLHRLQKL